MSSKTLEASVRHQPSVSVVDLHGEINIHAESVLNDAYAEAEACGLGGILLNCSAVRNITSTGRDGRYAGEGIEFPRKRNQAFSKGEVTNDHPTNFSRR